MIYKTLFDGRRLQYLEEEEEYNITLILITYIINNYKFILLIDYLA